VCAYHMCTRALELGVSRLGEGSTPEGERREFSLSSSFSSGAESVFKMPLPYPVFGTAMR